MPLSKPLLYRKVNTTARGVHHLHGGAFRHDRNTKQQRRSETTHRSMQANQRSGLDYTPLFKFLLSKVGEHWDAVYGEAVKRLDRAEPLFWLVARQEHDRRPYVLVGEASYFSGLYVDDQGILRLVDPSLGPSSLAPQCKCCTHTFNGVRFTKPFTPRRTTASD